MKAVEGKYIPGVGQTVDDPFGAPTDVRSAADKMAGCGTGAASISTAELTTLANQELYGMTDLSSVKP